MIAVLGVAGWPIYTRVVRAETLALRERGVQAALSRLSERDREVLLLWDAGLDYDEIAAQTGLARGAIGTTLSRARRRLVEAHRELGGRTGGRADGPDGKDGRGNDAALG